MTSFAFHLSNCSNRTASDLKKNIYSINKTWDKVEFSMC